MQQDFHLPKGLIGRFAIVKLWPAIKTAEDECIARLKIAATSLGIDCIEIHADGRLLDSPHKTVTNADVDFVLHLHYDTPKLYDAFSFVALWNPVHFYHEWGYARTSRNLLTHDDFVSCSSPAADDHVSRLTRNAATHLPPIFNLYHSIADIAHSPSLGDHKLFYAGINWDALRGGVSRHQELLQRLDKTGHLRIYGPTLFQGVQVWKGYNSYVREIPFDGVSMLDEIAKSGIALVLSSQAHKDSELMSNRLFESVAAGALVICDENNFAKKFFGDSLLYIDSRCTVEEIFSAIEAHLAWERNNPEKALAMIERAQAIFKEKFSLKKSLIDLYQGFPARKLELLKRQFPDGSKKIKVCLYLLMPEYSEAVLSAHIANAVAQDYENFSTVLVVDKVAASNYRSTMENTLDSLSISINLLEIDFYTYGVSPEIRARRKMGEVIAVALEAAAKLDAVVFVAPNERILSNHISVLASSLVRNPEVGCAATAAILKSSDQPVHGVHERIDFREFSRQTPIGFARFIFRIAALPNDLNLALPYLDRKVLAVLLSDNVVQEIPSTVIIDVTEEFPSGPWDEGQENNLIASYSPNAFSVSTGKEIIVPILASFPPAPGMSHNTIKRFSWNWVAIQINALRRDGLVARINQLKTKLNAWI